MKYAIWFLSATVAIATGRPANQELYSWLSGLGPASVTEGGTLLLPQNVLASQAQGQIPGVLQFVMQNHLMNKCIRQAIDEAPSRRTPFVGSMAAFNKGLCILSKCFQQEILMMVLPQLGAGLNDPATKDTALSMISAFGQGESCDGTNDRGIDPLLINLLTQKR